MGRIAAWMAEGAFISVVPRIEVLGFPDLSLSQFGLANELVSYFGEIPLDESVVQRCISLRRRRRIRLSDAIVVASAIEEDVPLVTRNTKDISWIDELTVIDPFVS